MSMPSEVAIDPAGSVLSLMPMHYVGGEANYLWLNDAVLLVNSCATTKKVLGIAVLTIMSRKKIQKEHKMPKTSLQTFTKQLIPWKPPLSFTENISKTLRQS